MNEVSCRVSAVLIETAELYGLNIDALLHGLDVPSRILRDPRQRLSWDSYVDLLERVYEQCERNDERLVHFAQFSVRTRAFHRLVGLIGAVTHPRQAYRLAARWGAPAFFPHVRYRFFDERENGIRIEAELPAEFRGSEVFFRIGVGIFQALPLALGARDPAPVAVTLDAHHATYRVTPPRALPLHVRLRRLLRFNTSTRALVKELIAQQHELQRSYVDLSTAHRQLAEKSAQFQLLMDNTADLISILDARGRVRYASSSHERILGYPPAELSGRSVLKFMHPDDVSIVSEAVATGLAAGGNSPAVEVRFRHKDGNWRILECFGSSIEQDGQISGIVSSRDVTARKQAEQRTQMLLDVARNLSAKTDIQSILDSVQSSITAIAGCERTATYCFSEQRGGFYLAAQHGIPPDVLERLQSVVYPPGEPFGGRVLDGETLVCNDVHAQSWLAPQVCEMFGIATYAVAPLRVRGRHFGLIIVTNSTAGQTFKEDQVQLLEGVARQIGVAIEAAELLRAQHAEAELSHALARISQEMISATSAPDALTQLCRLTTEVLHCDYSHTWLWDEAQGVFAPAAGYGDSAEEWESLSVLRIQSPLAEELSQQLRGHDLLEATDSGLGPFAIDRFSKSIANARVVVGLRRGPEVFGFHTAGHRDRSLSFTDVQKRLLRGIGQIAALAIEHVRVVEALERANHLKSEFVATMSHELRTPLNVIIGYTDLLRDQVFGNLTAQQADALQRIETRARELFDLITATLDLSRLESGRVALQLAPLNVRELVHELNVETQDLRRKPNVEFDWQVAEVLPLLHTDRLKLKVILKNLIGNALKFTDSGDVSVKVYERDSHLCFAVADSGIGIEPDILPVIFEPFRQGHTGPARQFGGVGLGLYIVRRLLDMLGGTVTVESVTGAGTTFTIALPDLAVEGVPAAQKSGQVTRERTSMLSPIATSPASSTRI